jgi:hypothetical protein
MIFNKYIVATLCLLFFLPLKINAQDTTITSMPLSEQQTLQNSQSVGSDSIPSVVDGSSLDKIPDIRTQFERQRSLYTKPVRRPESLLRFVQKKELTLSDEMMDLINRSFDTSQYFPGYITFKDTVIVNPLFLPLVAKGGILPAKLEFYNLDSLMPRTAYDNLYQAETIFTDRQVLQKIRHSAYADVRRNHPNLFKYTERDLPALFQPGELKIELVETNPLEVKPDLINASELDANVIKFIPERQYWQSAFESAIQFSQSYISPNWHKGGSGNLNLFMKNHLKYNYNKDKVQLTNEIESKVSFFNAPKDTLRDHKIGDDVLRLHSNLGYRAFNKWYYTLDGEFRTQLFKSFKENTNNLQSAFLAPLQLNLGLGMKYDLNKTFSDKSKSIKLSINMAPISYTFKYSTRDDIDFGRHGFEKKPETDKYNRSLSKFGSTIKTDMTINFNRSVSWQSRILYSTSYDRVEAEFENTLVMAISRFFSTRLYLYVRYDDGATKKEDFDSYFQLNELISFGFNYKW